jgi:hypothetical protein
MEKNNRKNKTVLFLILSSCVLYGCSTQSAKESVEDILNRRIGQSYKIVQDTLGAKCLISGNDPGCLIVSNKQCTIFYSVDVKTERITNWRYVSNPEPCWRFSNIG